MIPLKKGKIKEVFEIIRNFSIFCMGGVIFFLGSYFVYRYNNIELKGFLYTGITFFILFIILSIMRFTKKKRERDSNIH